MVSMTRIHNMINARSSPVARFLLVLLLALLGSSPAFAANHYIRPGGSGTGGSWSDPIGVWPTSPIRGDTYYLAAGNYNQPWQPNTAASGTIYCRFLKATVADHGTSTGWLDSYASGQGVLVWGNTADIRMQYLEIDGAYGTGNASHGIRIDSLSTNTFAIGVYNGFNATGLRLKHLEARTMTGNGVDAPVSSSKVIDISSTGGSGILIQDCYLHNGGQNIISLGSNPNSIIERNYLTIMNSGSGALHGDGISLNGANLIVRYNTFVNIAGTTEIEPQLGINGVYVYGNVFYDTSSAWPKSQGIVAITGTDVGYNVVVINNTAYNLGGVNSGIWGGNVPGSTVYATNNIWQNCVSVGSFPYVSRGNNIENTGEASFVDAAGGNFHLAAATTSGTAIGSPYNTDPDGVTRGADGAYDKGAFEYSSGGGGGTPGVFNLSSATYSVGEGTSSVTITVQRSGGSTGAVDVPYATSNGTATAGSDYTAASGTLHWGDGDGTVKTFDVLITDDATVESSETFVVALSSPTGGGALGVTTSATVTIADNDTIIVPNLGYPTWEAEAMLIESPFTASATDIVETLWTTDPSAGGRARAKITLPTTADYRLKALVNAPNAAANSIFVDWDQEPTDPLTVWDVQALTTGFEERYVSWRGNGTFDAPQFVTNQWNLTAGVHTIYVRGRESNTRIDRFTLEPVTVPPPNPGVFVLGSATYSVNANGGTLNVTVSRTDGSANAVTVNYATSNGSAVAGTDYTARSGMLSWAAGETLDKTISIPILNANATTNRTFTIALSGPTGAAVLGSPSSATITVVGMGVPGTIAVTSATGSISEGATPFTAQVSRTVGTSGGVGISYTTVSGTAIAGVNFTAASGTLSWAHNDSGNKTISVPIINTHFAGTKTFTIVLSTPTGGATLGTSTVTVTIAGTGAIGTAQLSAATYQTGATNGSVTVSITRASGSSGPLTASYATVNGTALAGVHYTAVSGSVSWTNNEVGAKAVQIPIINSGLIGPSRTFSVNLTGSAIGAPSSAVVTILNNNPPALDHGSITFSKANYGTTETSAAVTVTFQRTGGTAGAVGASWATANGSAVAGTDYTALAGGVTFPDGNASSATLSIPILDTGTISQTPRVFSISLSAPTGGVALGPNSTATVTIDMNHWQVILKNGARIFDAIIR